MAQSSVANLQRLAWAQQRELFCSAFVEGGRANSLLASRPALHLGWQA
jgi:hypothetical protein